MKKRPFQIVGLGEILWDLLPSGKQLGGAPANCAFHAGALGARGVMVSCVGDDEMGREILEFLQLKGIGVEYIAVDADHPTGTVSVSLDTHGQPTYDIHTDVAWDNLPLTKKTLALAAKCDAVCFGTLAQRSSVSRKSIQDFLRATRRGCLRVFDINLRQKFHDLEVILEMFEMASVLKINDEELPALAYMLDFVGNEDAFLDYLIDTYSLDLIALTKGKHGSLLVSAEEYVEHRGHRARVANTVGAGDAFTAALTVGLLRGQSLVEINDVANRLAAFVCSQQGPMPDIPKSLLD